MILCASLGTFFVILYIFILSEKCVRMKDLVVLKPENAKFSRGSAPDPAGGLTAPPRPPAALFSLRSNASLALALLANARLKKPIRLKILISTPVYHVCLEL